MRDGRKENDCERGCEKDIRLRPGGENDTVTDRVRCKCCVVILLVSVCLYKKADRLLVERARR